MSKIIIDKSTFEKYRENLSTMLSEELSSPIRSAGKLNHLTARALGWNNFASLNAFFDEQSEQYTVAISHCEFANKTHNTKTTFTDAQSALDLALKFIWDDFDNTDYWVRLLDAKMDRELSRELVVDIGEPLYKVISSGSTEKCKEYAEALLSSTTIIDWWIYNNLYNKVIVISDKFNSFSDINDFAEKHHLLGDDNDEDEYY